MSGLEFLEGCALRREQLWYVAHPVHPTAEEVSEVMWRLREYVGGSPGEREEIEAKRAIINGNIANAKAWLTWLIRKFPTITFIAPWIATLDGGGDDDLDPAMRARGLRDCRRTIHVCNGLVLVGGRISSGMAEESQHALFTADLTHLGREPPTAQPKETA